MAPEALAPETSIGHQSNDRSSGNTSDSSTMPATLRFADLPTNVKVAPNRGQTLRELYMKSIVKHFPTFKPRGDIDVFVLGSNYKWYQGPAHEDHIYAWVDEEFAKRVERGGGEERMMQRLSRSLNAVVEVTGIKPEPGEECPNVFVCPIPNRDYSIRLFPGAFARQEYCLDFVKTDTREPVNSPFEFEMWAVPGPSSSLHVVVPMRIRSLESASGVTPEDMKPGAEKFVLRDGMNCLLKRPGHRTVRFVVPIRVV